jgi:RNA polymerase sigma-70 factor (ECF subfamily)
MGIEGIDGFAARVIQFKAKQMIGKVGFTESDREDIEQDLALDVLHRMRKFDPTRAQRHTFVVRVVEHRIATIIEHRQAGIRDYRRCCGGFDEALIDEDEYLLRMGRISRPRAELRDLTLDVTDVVSQLPPKLRDLCERLKKKTVSEVAREMGIPRSTLYESIRRLRRRMTDAGLRDYLKSPDACGGSPVGMGEGEIGDQHEE